MFMNVNEHFQMFYIELDPYVLKFIISSFILTGSKIIQFLNYVFNDDPAANELSAKNIEFFQYFPNLEDCDPVFEQTISFESNTRVWHQVRERDLSSNILYCQTRTGKSMHYTARKVICSVDPLDCQRWIVSKH